MKHADLLIEIHTGELPPKKLLTLSDAFLTGITERLSALQFTFKNAHAFATPRRLAVLLESVSSEQPLQETIKRGPTMHAAFNEAKEPTKATLGFLRSLNITVDQLITIKNDQGEWIGYQESSPGKSIATCLPSLVEDTLNALPSPKRMHFGPANAEFVRPIHSIVLLYGDDVIPATIMGINSDRKTRGHRFHAPDWINIASANRYEETLRNAYVIADFEKRKAIITEKAHAALRELAKDKAQLLISSDDFLSEVTGLVEWPEALLGSFDPAFLAVPKEVLISSMQDHQRYFPVIDPAEKLLPHFVVITNINSKDPRAVLIGNERVLNARLSDAAFFYHTDQKETLVARLERLKGIVFQAKLGSLYDKATRLAHLAAYLSKQPAFSFTEEDGKRAGLLAKTDLTTLMVGEFPELQGIMGAYYALLQDETLPVSHAIREHYLPTFSGDVLPQSSLGIALALADRIDNLVGSFGLSQLPTGEKDPYGLRRAAISIIRIITKHHYYLDLKTLIDEAISQYGAAITNKETASQLLAFIEERMRVLLQDEGYTPDVFAAVNALHLTDLQDIFLRVDAVQTFKKSSVAADLLMANKRVSNILAKQTTEFANKNVDASLFQEPIEQRLFEKITQQEAIVADLCKKHQYQEALTVLSELHSILNEFFDKVMIMTDDLPVRENRILMLSILRSLFMKIADIALLQ